MNTNIKKFTPNVKAVSTPLIILVLTIVLFAVVYRIFIPKITRDYEEFKKTEVSVKSLEEKVDTLSQINRDVLSKSDVSVLVLPESNSGLVFLSQLNKYALDNEISIGNIQSRNVTQSNSNLTKLEIDMEVRAKDIQSYIGLFKYLLSAAPISGISEVTINNKTVADNLNITAEVSFLVYWGDLPTKIPEITQPIDGLNEEELSLFREIEGYQLPEFLVIDPQEYAPREDIFSSL